MPEGEGGRRIAGSPHAQPTSTLSATTWGPVDVSQLYVVVPLRCDSSTLVLRCDSTIVLLAHDFIVFFEPRIESLRLGTLSLQTCPCQAD